MEKTNSSEPGFTGLVICDKSVRINGIRNLRGNLRNLERATNKFPKVAKKSINSREADYFVEVSSASIKLYKRGLPKATSGSHGKRQPITKWSKKSRSNMLQSLFALDYSKLFADELRVPVMVTLTYPGDWESVAPTGESVKRHLSMFRKRYSREFGETFMGVWKLEFQRRGAPHVHVLTSIAHDFSDFQLWVSRVWSEIVNHPNTHQQQLHKKAGTQVKKWYSFFKEKPYLIAVYFGKHSSANSNGAKEYQNKVPQLWSESGSVGRFWGYWGMSKTTSSARITSEDSLFIQRTLRRWHRANSQSRRVRIRRVNQSTGVIQYRFVRRKTKRMSHQGGFISVPDGIKMTEHLITLLNSRSSKGREVGINIPIAVPKEAASEEEQDSVSCRRKGIVQRIISWLTQAVASLNPGKFYKQERKRKEPPS